MLQVLFITGPRAVPRGFAQTAMLYGQHTSNPPIGFAIGCGNAVITWLMHTESRTPWRDLTTTPEGYHALQRRDIFTRYPGHALLHLAIYVSYCFMFATLCAKTSLLMLMWTRIGYRIMTPRE
jgi:hypothetical protein